MSREDSGSPSGAVVVGMVRTLCRGQPPALGIVSEREAVVAVGLTTTLVRGLTLA